MVLDRAISIIEEGIRTVVTEVRFRGNTLLNDTALSRGLRLVPGDPLGLAELRTDEAAIRSRFMALGHRPRKSEAVCIAGDVAMEEFARAQVALESEHLAKFRLLLDE